jgi:tRNA pseudouridine synthase 9
MLAEEFSDSMPASYWATALEAGLVTLNGRVLPPDKRSTKVKQGDEIAHVTLRHEPPVWLPPSGGEISLRWEKDSGVGVVNKPAGLPVHACGAYLHNSVAAMIENENGDDSLHFPHRLDTVTSGLLLVARNKEAAKSLGASLAHHSAGDAEGEVLYWHVNTRSLFISPCFLVSLEIPTSTSWISV